uniref:Uncharacterized protein n=1 Tax=Panagrolaimus davidi TaxID=227884 RepID=A0A914P008_9BILA
MGKAFVDCKTGYAKERLVNLHNKAVEQIRDDILGRIKNEGIVAEVFEKLTDQLKNIFIKYKEKNEMLVELIEERRRHEEKLARLKAEAEETLQTEKMEHERLPSELQRQHEKEQQRQQIQAENERILEAQRHEEEMQRIQLENDRIIAQGKLEIEPMKMENDHRIAENEERNRLEFEALREHPVPYLACSGGQGAKDGFDVSARIYDDVVGSTGSTLLGGVFATVSAPFTIVGGGIAGIAKGVASLKKK